MSFVSELKRRKVFQVAAVYLVVAWLIMQVVDVVNEPLRLPEWFATVAILIVAIGFPIALILSWAFDLTPEGVVRDEGTNIAAQTGGRRIEYVLIGLLVVAMGWVLYRVEVSPSQPAIEVVAEETQREVLPNSIAVLPFENLSPDPNNDYFAAGIHESTLNQLAKIRDLIVIARTSVLQYEDNPPPIPEIAEALKVELVMEGSVRYANDRVLITVQLIDGNTGAHIWSDEYNRDLTDIFAVQGEIAENIAMALEAELLPAERQRIERPITNSSEAYVLYLKAISSFDEPSPATAPDLDMEFHSLLDQAILLDPNFAYAHAYKAVAYATSTGGVLRLSDEVTRADRARLAREHADLALTLDPNVGLAHAALARLHESYLREAEARQAYERAYQLSPNNPDVLIDYGAFSWKSDQRDDAVRLERRLAEVNPGYGHWALGTILCLVGDCGAALEPYHEAISLIPTNPILHAYLGVTEAILGNDSRALEELRIGESLWEGEFVAPWMLVQLAYGYGAIGRGEDALRVFNRIEEMAEEFSVGAATWSLAYLAIGDRDSALEWLVTAADDKTPDEGLIIEFVVRSNHLSDPILDQPEFVEVRSRLGFRE